MKKMLMSFCLVILFAISLSAKEHYIQIMSISDPNNLNSVKRSIHKLGHQTYVKKLGKWNIIYAGPFENSQNANKALSGIKKNISKDAFLTKITVKAPKKPVKKQPVPVKKKAMPAKKKTAVAPVKEKAVPVQKQEEKKVVKKVQLEDIIPAGEKDPVASVQKQEHVQVQKQVQQVEKQKKSTPLPIQTQETEAIVKTIPAQETIIVQNKKDKVFYVGLALGFSTIDVAQSGSLPLLFELDDSGYSISPEIGYYFNDNIFVSLNYQMTDLDNVTLNTAFTTLNYQLDEFYSISPFIGAIVGYSQRKWNKSPVSYASDIGTVSSLMGGVQIGSDISLYKGLSLYFYYRYLMMDTTTNIYDISGESKIEYGNEQDLNIGLKYHF